MELATRTIFCPTLATAPVVGAPHGYGAWSQAAEYDDFVLTGGGRPSKPTSLRIGRDENFLYVSIRCAEPNTREFGRMHKPGRRLSWVGQSSEHVSILLDHRHGHLGHTAIKFEPTGRLTCVERTETYAQRLDPTLDRLNITETPLDEFFADNHVTVDPDEAWTVQMALPFSSRNIPAPDDASVWGFQVVRWTSYPVHRGPVREKAFPGPFRGVFEESALCPGPGHAPTEAVSFADMIFREDVPRVVSLELDDLIIGWNHARAAFTAPPDTGGTVALGWSSGNPDVGEPRRGRASLSRDDSGRLAAEFDVAVDPHPRTMELGLDLTDSRGRCLWRAQFPMSAMSGMIRVGHAYRGERGAVDVAPDRADPDFRMKFSAYISSRQRRFTRSNTALGAPSDYTVQSADGSVVFDLMQAGALTRIADHVYDICDNDRDRILGASFLIGQRAFLREGAVFEQPALYQLDPLSNLRLGAGHCANFSKCLTAVLNRMKCEATGRPHQAYEIGVGGHVMVFVRYRGDFAVLDAMYCTIFMNESNTDLATLAEMRANPSLMHRVDPYHAELLQTFDRSVIDDFDPTEWGDAWHTYPTGAPRE